VEPQTIAIAALALAIIGHGIAWWFKTPKEAANEVLVRLDQAEDNHHELEVQFVSSSVKLAQQVEYLGNQIKDLAEQLKALIRRMDMMNEGRRKNYRDRDNTAGG